ncbi:hypothetical protein WAE56_15140 [Iodobacter sp. LRB]|uniref:hypothetical protein n=1 Tax=unclassified Iodobacter TaxID=235634 RepID=UPI0015D47BF3|nr:hypothetical protein [Iodobacter sp. BJB302]
MDITSAGGWIAGVEALLFPISVSRFSIAFLVPERLHAFAAIIAINQHYGCP